MSSQWNREGGSYSAPYSKYQSPRLSTSRQAPLLRIGKDITLVRVARWKALDKLVDMIWKAAGEPAVLKLVLAMANQDAGYDEGGRYVCIHIDDNELRDRITSQSPDVLVRPADWSPTWISPFVTDKVGLKKLYKQDRKALKFDQGDHEDVYENLRLLVSVASGHSGYINRFMPSILPPEVLVVCVKKIHWSVEMPASVEDMVARRRPDRPFMGLDITEGYLGSSEIKKQLFFFSAETEHLRDPKAATNSNIERRAIETASTYIDEHVLSSHMGSKWPVLLVAIRSEWQDISAQMISTGMRAFSITDSCSEIKGSVVRALALQHARRDQDRRARSRSPVRELGSSLKRPLSESKLDVKVADAEDVWSSFRLRPLVTVFIDEVHRAPRNLRGQAPTYNLITGCKDENVGQSLELYHAFMRLIKGPSVAQSLAGCTVPAVPEDVPEPIPKETDIDVKPTLDSDGEVVMLPAATSSASASSFPETFVTTKFADPYDDDDDDDY